MSVEPIYTRFEQPKLRATVVQLKSPHRNNDHHTDDCLKTDKHVPPRYFWRVLRFSLGLERPAANNTSTPRGDRRGMQHFQYAANRSIFKPQTSGRRELHTNAQSAPDYLLSHRLCFRITVHLETNLSHAKNRPATHLPRHACKFCSG